jgi:hypothetical protein
MPDEYGNEISTEPAYSAFWPVLILVVGLLFWSGYQAFNAYNAKTNLDREFQSAVPSLHAAQNAKDKLYAVAHDLIELSAKDPVAAQIVKQNQISIHSNDSGSSSSSSDSGKTSP